MINEISVNNPCMSHRANCTCYLGCLHQKKGYCHGVLVIELQHFHGTFDGLSSNQVNDCSSSTKTMSLAVQETLGLVQDMFGCLN